MSFEDKLPELSEAVVIEPLTRDQKLLLYTIDYLTKWMISDEHFNRNEGDKVWIKELPLWAIMYYQITHGSYETYDYAPTPIQFFGRSSFTVKNVEYDLENTIISCVWGGEDDPNLLGKNIEKISITYNETNSLLLSLEIETSELNIKQDELLGYVLNDLKAKGVLIK